jgi:hypothetical protein
VMDILQTSIAPCKISPPPAPSEKENK